MNLGGGWVECLTNRKIQYTRLMATFQMYIANQTDPHNVPLRDVVKDPLNQHEGGKAFVLGKDRGKITNAPDRSLSF